MGVGLRCFDRKDLTGVKTLSRIKVFQVFLRGTLSGDPQIYTALQTKIPN